MSNLFALVVIVCTLALSASLRLFAQQDIAYVSPTLPEDPNLAKVSMLRLLYTGGSGAPPICLVRKPAAQPATIIESGIGSGAITPYVPMRIDRFTLHTLKGNVTETPLTADILEEKKLAEPIEIELTAGVYQTLLIQEKNGQFKTAVLPDIPLSGETVPIMRVLDVSDLKDWSILLLDQSGKPIRTLWSSSTGSRDPVQLPSSGIFRIQALRQKADGFQQIGLYETKLGRGAPFSIILYPGPDGEGAADLAFDSAPGPYYNAELIKKLAEGIP